MGNNGSKKKEADVKGEVNFDHFQVLRAIGKGSFGKVCIVQKKDTEKMYAMKYMNKSQCEAKEAVANVFREMEILSTLSHPFLVNLWFSFQDEEDMFMVVDLLLGGDLRYHVQRGVQFTDEAVRLYVLEVASALEYLHRRKIIHRDIKPDNLLLDEEGHVHLTDFNIATVVTGHQLATSMSGTKPYMAPEVFECAMDTCEGYSYQVDWWSLGVTAYEVRRGKRPFEIHSNTPLLDIRLIFLTPPKYQSDWNSGIVHLITKLLTISPGSRLCSLESLQRIPFVSKLDINQIKNKQLGPSFIPSKEHLNCDPTFELEEMIIESKPLHKKKKRLLKQRSLRETQNTLSTPVQDTPEAVVYEKMLIFNREKEEEKKKREKKEKEWLEELERSMSLSDPVGLGTRYSGSDTPPIKTQLSEDAQDGGLLAVIDSTFNFYTNRTPEVFDSTNNEQISVVEEPNSQHIPNLTSEEGGDLDLHGEEGGTLVSEKSSKPSDVSDEKDSIVVAVSIAGATSLLTPSISSLAGSSEPSPEPISIHSSATHSDHSSTQLSSSPSSMCSSRPSLPQQQSQSPSGSPGPSHLLQKRTNEIAVVQTGNQEPQEPQEPFIENSTCTTQNPTSSVGGEPNLPAQPCQGDQPIQQKAISVVPMRPHYSLSTSKSRPRSQPCFNIEGQFLKDRFSAPQPRRGMPHSSESLHKHSSDKTSDSGASLNKPATPKYPVLRYDGRMGSDRSYSLEESVSSKPSAISHIHEEAPVAARDNIPNETLTHSGEGGKKSRDCSNQSLNSKMTSL